MLTPFCQGVIVQKSVIATLLNVLQSPYTCVCNIEYKQKYELVEYCVQELFNISYVSRVMRNKDFLWFQSNTSNCVVTLVGKYIHYYFNATKKQFCLKVIYLQEGRFDCDD